MPLKLAVLELCDAPNPVPEIVTVDPIGPTAGDTPVTESWPVTVNGTPLLVTPLAVIVTGPLVAPDGTAMIMLVSLHDVALPTTPLNCTKLSLPGVAPKPEPLRVTCPPTWPPDGTTDVISGLITVNIMSELLDVELTTAVTGPEVAPAGTTAIICELFQLVIEAVTPFTFATLLP
jgi:hypothetical protein